MRKEIQQIVVAKMGIAQSVWNETLDEHTKAKVYKG